MHTMSEGDSIHSCSNELEFILIPWLLSQVWEAEPFEGVWVGGEICIGLDAVCREGKLGSFGDLETVG